MKNTEEEISILKFYSKFLEALLQVRYKWKFILLLGISGSILGLVYSYTIKPIYISNLTFALEDKSRSNSGLSSIASSFGLNLAGGEGGAFAGDNIIELMKSRYLIEKTLLTQVEINNKQDYLINRFLDFNKSNKIKSKKNDSEYIKFINSNRSTFKREQDSVLGYICKNLLKNNLEVTKLDKKLSIFSVKVKTNDEVFSKLFCENLVKNVTEFYLETKTGKSKQNIQILELRVDSVRKELDYAMYGRANFSDQNNSLIRQSAAVPKLKQELKVQLLTTMYTELVKNLELSKLTLIREEPLIQIIDRPIYPLETIKFSKLKGIILGGIIFTLLASFFLAFKYFLSNK